MVSFFCSLFVRCVFLRVVVITDPFIFNVILKWCVSNFIEYSYISLTFRVCNEYPYVFFSSGKPFVRPSKTNSLCMFVVCINTGWCINGSIYFYVRVCLYTCTYQYHWNKQLTIFDLCCVYRQLITYLFVSWR